MIAGSTTRTHNALDLIYISPFLFHLTGSRAFGTAISENSDYDFFVEDKSGLREWLRSSGFRLDHESYAGDPMMTSVWAKDNVHVQVVNSFEMKGKIQWAIAPLIRCLDRNKDLEKLAWRCGTQCYLRGTGHGK